MTDTPAPKKKRPPAKMPEERLAALEIRRDAQTARIDARIRQIKGEVSQKKRREETARLLDLGRSVDGLTGLAGVTGDAFARLVVLGRWADALLRASSGMKAQSMLDTFIRTPRERELVGLPPLPEPAPAAEPEPPQAPQEET